MTEEEELDMTKIQKIGADGKLHYYWQYTPEEIAVMKQKAEERRKQQEEEAAAKTSVEEILHTELPKS